MPSRKRQDVDPMSLEKAYILRICTVVGRLVVRPYVLPNEGLESGFFHGFRGRQSSLVLEVEAYGQPSVRIDGLKGPYSPVLTVPLLFLDPTYNAGVPALFPAFVEVDLVWIIVLCPSTELFSTHIA